MENSYINLKIKKLFEKMIDKHLRKFLFSNVMNLSAEKIEMSPFIENSLKEALYVDFYLKEKAIAIEIFERLNKEYGLYKINEELFSKIYKNQMDNLLDIEGSIDESTKLVLKEKLEEMIIKEL